MTEDDIGKLAAIAQSVVDERPKSYVEAARLLAPAFLELVRTPNPIFHKHKCPACGKLTRDTTAGCDHCNLEDK
jgi:hypothetical protein